MTKSIAFHGDKKIKEKYVARVKAHYDADEIIHGKYWENGKGCAVGCTVEVNSNAHDQFHKELGISWRIALIEDSIFENLENGEAKKFPLEFLKAVPVGVDTELVYKKFVIWVLGDKKDGLVNVIKDKKQKDLLGRILALYKKSLKTEITQSEWIKLADEVYASASSYASASAYAYASAYASSYASSASAYASSASASASAYASEYGTDKWQDIFDKRIVAMKNKLLELMRKAK